MADLFKDTPAIRAAFSTVNPNEFNRRLDNLMQFDPVMGVKSMHALGALSKERPALPQLADSVSSVIDRFARYYQATPARQAEYNAAIDLVNRLLDVDPKAVTDGAYVFARVVRYAGESEPLFPLSVTHPDVTRVNEYHFPELTTWKVCDDSGSVFLNSKPESDLTDVEGRDTLWSLYDILRTGFCIYANRSGPRVEITGDGTGAKAEAVVSESIVTGINVTAAGSGYTTAVVTIDSSPGPGSGATATATISGGQITGITVTAGGSAYVPKSDNSPGAFMRNATAVLKNSGDVELRVRNIIYDLQNKLGDYSASEKTIADWTVNNSNVVFQAQTAVVDYLIDHVYPITRKDFVFNDGKEVLDREAEHLSMLNPDGTTATNDKFLTEWLLKSLNSDAEKLDNLDSLPLSDPDTNSALYKFGQDMVENTAYGLRSITNRYAQSTLKQKLISGSVYTSNTTPSTDKNFSGLLSNGGPIWRLTQSKSTQVEANLFRQLMAPRISSLVGVPSTYNNEFYFEAALKNFYYHILDRYYDGTNRQWALTAEEAQASFGDPERNLQSYVAQMQYSMRNMAILNRIGTTATGMQMVNGQNVNLSVPYLTEFLYTIAAANGYVDPENAPGQLKLRTCLTSMGATDIADNGIRTINVPINIIGFTIASMEINSQVTNAESLYGMPASLRNNELYSASLDTFAFELITPGRFMPRNSSEIYAGDTVNGPFRGRFSPHQGDIESTNLKTSNWMVAEFSLNGWEGYGPYSVKGKAPNGSAVKYENDYYTDGFRARIAMGDDEFRMVPMGTNGIYGGTLYCPINSDCEVNGNLHVYEMVYRPKPSDGPCWAEAQGSTATTYARYGFIRPSNNTNYWDTSAATVGCDGNPSTPTTWQKVQIDFDSLDEAIRANIEWVLKYKKYVFVIPMAGHDFRDAIPLVGPRLYAGFVVFSTIHGNGLWGVTTGKRACSTPSCNGQWNVSGVTMGADAAGDVPNFGVGFESETAAGGAPGVNITLTRRLGRTSFAAGDSMVLLDKTFRQDGLIDFLNLVDLNAQIWSSLGDGPVTPAMIKDNFDSVLTLADARYQQSEVLTGTVSAHRTTPSMANFAAFYNSFFPTDETTCVAGVLAPGAGGGPDLLENYQNGCGVTARDLPPVPKVNPNTSTCNEFINTGCIKYPATYNTDGSVATWFDFRGPSDGKLTGMLTPLIMLFGTMHEDGRVLKVTSYPNASPLSAGESRDSVTIRNFCSNGAPGCTTADLGYRVELDTLFDALASLNETHKNSGNNLPQYETAALTNIITESAAGLRNGFVPKLTNNKYANVAYLDPLIRDLEGIIADNVRKIEDGLEITSGTMVSASGLKNRDRLRYFATKNAVNPEIEVEKMVISTPGIVQKKYHGLEAGDKVYITTAGTLPSGISAGTAAAGPYYFVKAPVTSDTFQLSATSGGAAIAFGGASAGTHKIHPVVFRTNRFDQSVNGTALNGIPINMMKEFVKYLRSLASDAEVVAAIKAAIPMLNNYLNYVQNSTSQITLTDEDIDHIVDFIRDTNSSGDPSIDTFLDMLVATKMDDLNTLRSFNFEQFKTLGSYESVFDDINDKVNKYFEINIKKDLLYSPFMLGEPTCPGGSQNGFYDHNENGTWDPGTFTFISASYAGASSWTDTANVGGSCTITTQVPNIYDKDYYMFDMGGVARNLQKAINEVTDTDIDNALKWLYGRQLSGAATDVVYGANPDNGGKTECYVQATVFGVGLDFEKEVKAFKNRLFCEFYNKKLEEPHYDRNNNNIIETGEFTDINGNGIWDDKASATPVMMRRMINYYLEEVFMPKYQEYISPDPLSAEKNYVSFGANALKDLLSPTVCDANGLNCGVNANYVTADLLQARSTFYASTNFTSDELKSVKNVIGNFLYDTETNTYTELLARTGPHIVTVLQEFQGDYNDLLNMGLQGFKSDGFMTYFSTNLTNKSPYTSLDVLTDVRTLFNTQAMRCYPGITGEYAGGPLYCKKYKALDTFWGQFGLLMDQFSSAAYHKYKNQWQSQMNSTYYARLVSIFE